jgi:hypothetical protein
MKRSGVEKSRKGGSEIGSGSRGVKVGVGVVGGGGVGDGRVGVE